MQRNVLGGIIAAATALLLLLSLLTPWWTVHAETTGRGSFPMDVSGRASAGPFDDGGGIIGDAQAVWSGVLVLTGLLAIAAVAVLSFVRPQLARVQIGLSVATAFLVALTAILAITTWPDEGGMDFWDSQSGTAMGITFEGTSYAGFGWYTAVAAAVAAGFATVYALPAGMLSPGRPTAQANPVDAPPAMAPDAQQAQCQGVTKAGSRCSRRAASGTFCVTHG